MRHHETLMSKNIAATMNRNRHYRAAVLELKVRSVCSTRACKKCMCANCKCILGRKLRKPYVVVMIQLKIENYKNWH